MSVAQCLLVFLYYTLADISVWAHTCSWSIFVIRWWRLSTVSSGFLFEGILPTSLLCCYHIIISFTLLSRRIRTHADVKRVPRSIFVHRHSLFVLSIRCRLTIMFCSCGCHVIQYFEMLITLFTGKPQATTIF